MGRSQRVARRATHLHPRRRWRRGRQGGCRFRVLATVGREGSRAPLRHLSRTARAERAPGGAAPRPCAAGRSRCAA
ncbi:hypothetical protein ABD05_32680 [Burkholderia pyrrocinia]|nr:hypothetical protein ABD05_32680 [Burkholderia pyrrocinia]